MYGENGRNKRHESPARAKSAMRLRRRWLLTSVSSLRTCGASPVETLTSPLSESAGAIHHNAINLDDVQVVIIPRSPKFKKSGRDLIILSTVDYDAAASILG